VRLILKRLGFAVLVVLGLTIGASGVSALIASPQADDGTYCGRAPLVVLIHGGKLTGAAAAQCQTQALIQIGIGIFLVALGVLLVLLPRVIRAMNAREAKVLGQERALGVWGHEPATRRVAWILAAGFSLFFAVSIVIHPNVFIGVFAFVVGIPYVWLMSRFLLHPHVDLRPGEIVIVGAFRTRRVSVDDVVSVSPPGDFGCFLRLRHGNSVRIPVGATNRVAPALGHRTHGDELVEAIAAHVAESRHVPEMNVLPTPHERLVFQKNARAALLAGLSWLAVMVLLMFLHHSS
jgi:hypothetical protein